MKKLAILVTHPIQYYAPIFRLLTERNVIALKVFYSLGDFPSTDKGFGKKIEWDIPLLEGYAYEFIRNSSGKPETSSFNGIINPDLIKKIDAYRPDAILIYGWSYQSHLKAIRHYYKKVPVLFRGDSILLDPSSFVKQILRSILLRWVYRHVDVALYVGTENKQYFRKYGVQDNNLIFAPHAVDNDRFATHQPDMAQQVRASIGLIEGDVLILFAGKFEHKKAPDLLLDAFLAMKQPKVHLLFAGNGVLEDKLKSRAEHEKNVHFVDFQNQTIMPAFYQACDLFCLPSRGPAETWGLAVNEAMAAGKAILVSNKVGCATDLVKEGKNGMVFDPENEAELIKKLHQLCENKANLQTLGKASESIIADWTFLAQAKAIESAF